MARDEGYKIGEVKMTAKVKAEDFKGMLTNVLPEPSWRPVWCKHPEGKRTPMYSHQAFPFVPFRMLDTAPKPVGYQCRHCGAGVREAVA